MAFCFKPIWSTLGTLAGGIKFPVILRKLFGYYRAHSEKTITQMV